MLITEESDEEKQGRLHEGEEEEERSREVFEGGGEEEETGQVGNDLCTNLDSNGNGNGNESLGFGMKVLVVGAGARILFYPTLFYNVVRNKFEPNFRWWDQIEQVSSLSRSYFCPNVL